MSQTKFHAELTDFKMIFNILRAITLKEYAIIHPMEEGLKVTLEEMRSVETSAYIPASLFTSYNIDPNDDVKFKISLKLLTECLNIYGDHGDDGRPSLKLSYKTIGSPLRLVIKHDEENISVDCEIQTMNADEFSELSLSDECDVNKVVVSAAPLYEVLNDIDPTSDDFHLLLSPEPPYFRMTSTGIMGESVVDITKTSKMVTLFQCTKVAKFSYAFSNIKQILKVLSFANKVSISTGETGLLGLQFVINANELQMYVEYYVTSLFNVDE